MKTENTIMAVLKKTIDIFLIVLQIPFYLLFLAALALTITERNIPDYDWM